MYTLLRSWALAILGMLLLFILVLLVLTIGGGLSGLWKGLAVVGMFGGFVHFPQAAVDACDANKCNALTASMNDQVNASGAISLVYVVGLVLLCVVMVYAAPRLQRARINALVIAKLRQADETYIAQVLGVGSFDKSRMGQTEDGRKYVNDVLLREATDGQGDAQFTQRSDLQLRDSAAHIDKKSNVFQRWAPIYAKYAKPTFAGGLLVAGRTFLLLFLIVCGWFALSSMSFWVIPLLVVLGAFAMAYVPQGRWRDTYCQLAANDTYTALSVLVSFIYCAVGFLVFFVVGFFKLRSGGIQDVLPPLSVFGWVPLLMVVVLSASNYFLYRYRMNAQADSTLADFFRLLLSKNIHGTHSFAECPSCDTVNILLLGQAHPCDACGAMVDTSMNVRSVDV